MRKHFQRLLQRLRGDTLIDKAARFVACEMVEGDYLEFGTFEGRSLIEAYRSLERQFRDRIAQETGGVDLEESRRRRRRIWDEMRFFGFDSFEGLPAPTGDDTGSDDFKEGMYVCSEASFVRNVVGAGVPRDKLVPVKGWFAETCVPATRERLGMERAAIVWIDGDLYSSAASCLSFVTDLLQDGTVLIFDDWFAHRGSPFAGEQRAFNEWIATPEVGDRFAFREYQRESWCRMSFIASRR